MGKIIKNLEHRVEKYKSDEANVWTRLFVFR